MVLETEQLRTMMKCGGTLNCNIGSLFLFLLFFKEYVCEFMYYTNMAEYETARTNCSAVQMAVAKIDTSEKWIEMFTFLTNGGRKFPEQNIYIGLTYVNGVYRWSDGTEATWTKWYTNEPYNVVTRHCVILGVDADLHFRTTDCTYQYYYLCSTDDSLTETPGYHVVANQQTSSSQEDMVIGLSAGFGAFSGVVAVCCILCWCCCGSKDQSNPQKYTNMRSQRNPKMPANYNRHSPGGNSYDTFVTSRSSRMDDFDIDSQHPSPNRLEIDYDGQKINYSRNEDFNLKIHCPNDDTCSMNDSSVSSKRSLDVSTGLNTRSREFLHYI